MHETINTSKLVRQVSEKITLSEEEQAGLYDELSQMPNGYVKDVLAALIKKAVDTRYAACIKGSSVRDAQYEKKTDSSPLDDDAWVDAVEMPLFLKVVEASTPSRAVQIAAAYAGVDENVIELFPMA